MADDLTMALKGIAARAPVYRKFRCYYRGEHDLAFATDKFRTAFGRLFRELADNLCPAVVNAVADRLDVQDISAEQGTDQDAQAAWEVWRANRMDRKAGLVHTEALKVGDAYVIVWPDAEGMPTITPQRADRMFVQYDPEDDERITHAAKVWPTPDGYVRATLYYADRIEKYVTRNKTSGALPETSRSFIPYEVVNEPWPVPNPYGVVPVTHFPNDAQMETFGTSELANVVPIQDALNKTIADMLVAMEFVALPQRWATGLEIDIDETTGKPIVPFTPGVERIWAVDDNEVKFGEFAPANLSQFTTVQNDFRAEVARISGTPFHYMMLSTGDFPSGESMKTAEERFLSKVRDRQMTFGNAWEDTLAIALLMRGNAAARFALGWRDPAPRSEKEHAETLVLKRELGISKRQALKELDYGDEDIDAMLAENATDAAAQAEQTAKAFNAGTIPSPYNGLTPVQ